MNEAGLLVLLCLPIMVTSYSGGAGPGACSTMTPNHTRHGYTTSQVFPSPFTITVDKATYSVNQEITVTLAGFCSRQFKGFFIQARDANPTVADAATAGFGTFTNVDSSSKVMCSNQAATHTGSVGKGSVQVKWTTSSAHGHIVFIVSFVESQSTVWEKQRSSIIRDSTLQDTPSYTGVPSPVLTGTCNTGSGLVKPSGCGSTMGCFTDCDSSGCNNVVTWQGHADHVQFSIKGKFPTGVTSGYMALGFSDDMRMGSDGVTECVYLDTGSPMTIHNSHNVGRDNTRYASVEATFTSGAYTNGIFECDFELPLTNANQLFDTKKNSYLLLARALSAQAGNIGKHSQLPLVSSVKADFQKNEDLTGGSSSNTLVKVHGSLMVIAWIFAASIGIVVARYFKPQWPDSTLFGQNVWFQLHRGFMMLVFLAAATAFVIIFVDVMGYSDLGDEAAKKAHPILGIIVTALAVINPIMAIFRPHPGDANRPIFNWAHFGVGSAAHILAVVTIFLGVNLGTPAIPGYVTWILVGYVAWQVLIEFLLVFVRCHGESKDRSESYEMAQKGYHANRQVEPSGPKSSPIRMGLLLLHIIAITAFATAVVVCIVIS